MGAETESALSEDQVAAEPATALGGLPGHREQTRNLILFGANTALFYLAAPVLLVGNLQAAVCKQLGASDFLSNLPGSAYLVMATMPVFVAWLFPRVALLKRVLVICYVILAVMGAAVVAVLLSPAPNPLKVAVVIVEGGVTGGALTVATMFLFEVLGRAVAPSRRGAALALGYGAGPFLALASSLGSQLLLPSEKAADAQPGAGPAVRAELPAAAEAHETQVVSGKLRGALALFAASVPVMALAGFLSTRFVIPLPKEDLPRRPFFESVLGGIGDFLNNPVLLVTTIVCVLGFAFYQIGANMTLYTKAAVGKPPEEFVGYQLALRFGFKGVFGLAAGWLLARTNPKVGVLVPALSGLTGVLWAMAVPGWWFFLGFGFLGAGELFGVYATNYILCCSSSATTRRNMGFASLMMFPAFPAGALYGMISDHYRHNGAEVTGFRLSFAAAAASMVLALFLAFTLLPARPRPDAG